MKVRVVVSLRSLALPHSFLAHIAWLKVQDVWVFVSSHPCMKWAFSLTSLISSSPSSSFSHSSSTSSSSFYPSSSPRLRSKIQCATSPRRWGQLTSPSPTQALQSHSGRSLIDLSCRMCNQFTFHHQFGIDTWRSKIWATNRQYSFCLWIPWTKTIRILVRSTCIQRVMHNTCIKHGRNIITQFFG